MLVRRLVITVAVLLSGSLTACGGSTSRSTDAGTFAGVALAHTGDAKTIVRWGDQTATLAGRFEHARVAPEFRPDAYASAAGRLLLEDTANATTRERSRFALLDTGLAERPTMIELNGDFAYDAISPDGGTVFLVSYFSIERPSQYAVRSYNVAAGKLDSPVVADKSVLLEGPMNGTPVARAATESGAWVYTAYRGEHGFVHALDTVNKTAFCIDFPHDVAHVDDWKLDLDERRNRLTATSATTGAVTHMDTQSFMATTVAPPRAA